MSRRDQIFQTFAAVQDSVYQLIDERTSSFGHAPGPSAPSSSSSAGTGANVRRSDTTATTAPPLYHRQPRQGADEDEVPDEVRNAAPGHAQEALDQMPRTRMAKGDAREARRAAAALREEQLRSGALKTRHSFASQNGRVLLDVSTPPQKTLTFMGGSQQRGTGAIKGKVTVHAQEGDRVSAIRLKIKAVAKVQVPRAGTAQAPFPLSQAHPNIEPCVEKEVLLLQLESKLWTATKNKDAPSTFPAVEDPTVLTKGSHDFAFSIDLPAQTSKGEALPPSFVLQPVITANQAAQSQQQRRQQQQQQQQQQRRSGGSGLDDMRGKVAALTSALPLPGATTEWASVKWYAKLTVERPGMFRANDRVFAPFVYLPPPPAGKDVEPLLHRRLRLAAEIDATLRASFAARNARADAASGLQMMLDKLAEPLGQWEPVRLVDPMLQGGKGKQRKAAAAAAAAAASPAKGNDAGPGFFSKLLFGAQVTQTAPNAPSSESWTLLLPRKPKLFALRSGIPYLLIRDVEWKGHQLDEAALSRVPTVALYQRTRTYARAKGPVSGHLVRNMSLGRQSADADPIQSVDFTPKNTTAKSGIVNRRKDSYLGIVDLPPTCSPCFDTSILTLEYFVGVQLVRNGPLVHSEPVVLSCPPPMPPPAPQPPSGQRRRAAAAAVGSSSSNRPQASRTPTTSKPAKPSPSRVPSSAAAAAAAANPASPARTSTGQPARRPPPPAQAQAGPSSRPATQPARTSTQHNHGYPDEKRRLASSPASSPSPSPAPPSVAAQAAAAAAQTSAAPPPLPSRAQAPLPPLPPAAAPTTAPHSTQSSVNGHGTPIGGGPDHELDDDDDDEDEAASSTGHTSHDAHAWRFAEDDLVTDLPPSYFEATGVQDRDD
ncbi:hypothetical protein FA10DRAFT_257118 [Acaromyces ingoldii]|uniref:Uncharacterized protein n=1 Tax=Acaromyces ingoldii TaxID=215250 RepID=A0A316YU86_9BASI|nr:hypothetical protein FA10DRAFT_257118 [Acaromyces ingoldii]PWN92662.1 hypothetical protein FA10DRAFT_257118 [Acaromyces ingoldii]